MKINIFLMILLFFWIQMWKVENSNVTANKFEYSTSAWEITGTQSSPENWASVKFRQPTSPEKWGSLPEKEELQLSTTVTVEESVEFPVTVSKNPSVMMSSSLGKSSKSSTMKWSPGFCSLFSCENSSAPAL